MGIERTDQATEWICEECGQPVVYRREVRHTAQGSVPVSPRYLCSSNPLHAVGPLTVNHGNSFETE